MSQAVDLNSRASIATLDLKNVLGSVDALHQQVHHAWQETKDIQTNFSRPIANVVIAGMGGSGLGADVIKTVYKENLAVPLDFVHDYTLPGYVSPNTLVVLASYSGTTEEILNCAKEAEQKGSMIAVIAAGGKLAEWAQEKSYPIYQINPTYNPSGQPRMAIGYAVFGTVGLLAAAGVLHLTDEEVEVVVNAIKSTQEMCTVESPTEDNPAKTLAFQIIDRRPVIVVSEFLEGPVHVSVNQHNENAKIFMDYKVVPELNHHLMEGLQFPKSNASTHLFVLINSLLYRPENQIRVNLTQKIIEENEIDTMMMTLKAPTKLAQAFELITMLGYCAVYLAMLEGIDPAPIPWVDKFKDEMKKFVSQ